MIKNLCEAIKKDVKEKKFNHEVTSMRLKDIDNAINRLGDEITKEDINAINEIVKLIYPGSFKPVYIFNHNGFINLLLTILKFEDNLTEDNCKIIADFINNNIKRFKKSVYSIFTILSSHEISKYINYKNLTAYEIFNATLEIEDIKRVLSYKYRTNDTFDENIIIYGKKYFVNKTFNNSIKIQFFNLLIQTVKIDNNLEILTDIFTHLLSMLNSLDNCYFKIENLSIVEKIINEIYKTESVLSVTRIGKLMENINMIYGLKIDGSKFLNVKNKKNLLESIL